MCVCLRVGWRDDLMIIEGKRYWKLREDGISSKKKESGRKVREEGNVSYKGKKLEGWNEFGREGEERGKYTKT